MSAAGRKCGRLTAVVKMRRPDVREFELKYGSVIQLSDCLEVLDITTVGSPGKVLFITFSDAAIRSAALDLLADPGLSPPPSETKEG